jgi:hypothetical protein
MVLPGAPTSLSRPWLEGAKVLKDHHQDELMLMMFICPKHVLSYLCYLLWIVLMHHAGQTAVDTHDEFTSKHNPRSQAPVVLNSQKSAYYATTSTLTSDGHGFHCCQMTSDVLHTVEAAERR